ncbi:MAG TPA: TonB-dependent receptor, partial [Gemmatimonadaceae bacterium]|nr:TonB-dependent receptor [Gemmatimonadaceae bacterium]
ERERFESSPNVAAVSLSSRAMEAVPRLGEADVIRVVQLLPGVAARNDFSTGLNVRGGEADQNLILVDGYPIYNPFHLGGLFSTFMDGTVRDISLLTGGFPARYGGRLSGVLDVRSVQDTRPGLHGAAELSALGATGQLGGAIGGGMSSWTVAARRTYADRLVDLFSDEVLPYHFRDLHAHATLLLPGAVRLGVTGYDGEDVLDVRLSEVQDDSSSASAGEGDFFFRWGNRVVGATLSRTFEGGARLLGWRLGDSVTVEQRVSRSTFATFLDLGHGSARLRSDLRDTRFAGAITAHAVRHDWTLGYEVSSLRLGTESGSSQTSLQLEERRQRGTALGVYIDDLWRVSPRWLVQAGVRIERLSARDWSAVSPRLSIKHFLTPDMALTAAAGHFTQWTHSLGREDSPVRIFDSWVASDSVTPVAAAWHTLAGFERRLGASHQVRIEGFHKRYVRLLESSLSQDPSRPGDEFVPIAGGSYGLDVLLRRFEGDGAGLSGWFAYTWSVSSREEGGVRYFPGHDRRHNLNLVASWRRGPYLLGARFGYASGTPYTRITGQFVRRTYNPVTNQWDDPGRPPADVDGIGGPRNGERLPATQRLDLNLSREFRRGRAIITPFVSVVNASNAENVFLYIYDYGQVPATRRTISQFPVVPSAGVSVVF